MPDDTMPTAKIVASSPDIGTWRNSRPVFPAAANTAGARGANGLSMLLHQGALSFKIWFHRDPDIEVMRAALLADQKAKAL